jgi:hypothetical protein
MFGQLVVTDDTGPEIGTLGEERVVVYVVRSVAGKGQTHHSVEDVSRTHAQVDGGIDQAQRPHGFQ